MSDTRSSLLKRVKDLGDDTSWVEFDKLYRPLLVHYGMDRGLPREAAEETAQQCMADIAGGIASFQRRVSFRGWLRGMIENKVKDQLRKRRLERGGRTADFDREQTQEGNPALVWERQWNRTHLLYCLNLIRDEISPVTYQAFELYVIAERPVGEIAAQLDMTRNQIYVAKHRVLARLKNRWSDLADGMI